MRRILTALALLLGLTLLAAPPASVTAAASTENRASGSAAVAEHLVGKNTRLSHEVVRENLALRYDFASDSPVAAEGGMAGIRALGLAGEDAVGIAGNTQRIASATDTAAYRIPDNFDPASQVIGEVKNVGSLSYTNQLRDFSAFASENPGWTFQLYVRPTTQLSGPLQQAIGNGDIVLRFIP